MDTLSLDQFIAERNQFDEAVLKTPDIFHFCSGSSWQLAAHKTLYPDRETLFLKDGQNYQAWAVGPLYEFSKVLQPLEADWCFGCPLIGSQPGRSMRFLLDSLLEIREEYPLVWLSGIPEDSILEAHLLSQFTKHFRLYRLEGCHCQVADLRPGLESYLSNRSGKFRRDLSRIREKAHREGITCDYFDRLPESPSSFLQRILRLEALSWKGQSAESIFIHERFRNFYLELIRDLNEQGNFRALFLQHEGRDIAYAMGGMLGTEYRGFQTAYHQELAHLSPGHLAQYELIRHLCQEGSTHYDLGMELAYKSRWADRTQRIFNGLLLKR